MPNYRLRSRPPLYRNPDELLDYFFQYILNCIDEQRMPTKEGMTVHCFNGRSQRFKYEHLDDYNNAFEIIYDVLADETVNNKHVDSQVKKLVLQSKFNYSEKVTTENVNVNENLDNLSKEERQSRINELLQKMNKDK